MGYRVDPAASIPPSRQLVEAVLDGIASGELTPGARLLSVRAMAGEALVNPNTVAKAYRELTVLGVVAARNGSGVFVTTDGPGIARAHRQASTLANLEQAVLEARRAGHDEAEIRNTVEKVCAEKGKKRGRRSA
ncbi:MAG: GntR family transcriptional regulator [Planctomycetota bacterium]|jgi:GntR family transcriptional regulator